MRNRFFVICCAAAMAAVSVACGPPAEAETYEETGRKTIALEGEEILFVGNKRGDIALIGEDGRTGIEIVFEKKVRAEDGAEAEKIANGMSVVFERKNGELFINAEYPEVENAKKSLLSILLQRDPRFSMDMAIRVPSHMIMHAKTSSGDIALSGAGKGAGLSTASGDVAVEGVEGDVEISVSSGDVDIKEIAGNVKVSAASGDITAETIAGDAEVQTSSGDVELDYVDGDLKIVSSSGDVSVKGVGAVTYKGSAGDAEFYGVRGSVQAGGSSGDMTFHLEPKGGNDYTVRTSSGGIVLRFVEKMPGGFALKANTTNGDISVNLPIEITKVGRHYIAGVVRDGRSAVTLETVSGDIGVFEEEE
ncbi:MAG TPA: hypothetical protein ENO08_06965 [Candidatus Eisenbacteria bacterium]|uniref:DUF4097 domain-containing protein n=1 Tax=Eiseniibacteriota bacterium TaxID=2212470 RepID=A0A7V2AVS4_UNCEI|nr:hypothetical protein [Candidatus Eisenbacteria bacterium]